MPRGGGPGVGARRKHYLLAMGLFNSFQLGSWVFCALAWAGHILSTCQTQLQASPASVWGGQEGVVLSAEEQWECHFSHVSREGSEVRDVAMVHSMCATQSLRGTWRPETTYTPLWSLRIWYLKILSRIINIWREKFCVLAPSISG